MIEEDEVLVGEKMQDITNKIVDMLRENDLSGQHSCFILTTILIQSFLKNHIEKEAFLHIMSNIWDAHKINI